MTPEEIQALLAKHVLDIMWNVEAIECTCGGWESNLNYPITYHQHLSQMFTEASE